MKTPFLFQTDAARRPAPCTDRLQSELRRHTVIPGLWPITGPESRAGFMVPALPAEGGIRTPEQRVSRDHLDRIARRLSQRDWHILHSLKLHHFLSTIQLERFHFGAHATPAVAARLCRRVLGRLAELRVIEHLERRIGGVHAGSAAYVWRVGVVGDRLLRLDQDGQPRARRKEPSLRHLDHCLTVADIHLGLRDVDTVDLAQVQGEPASWRAYLSPDGTKELLKPDLAATTTSGEFTDSWFFEADRGTESLPTVLRKCGQYEAYRRAGQEQAEHGVFPLVVWVMASRHHVDRLQQAIGRSRELTAELFRVCTLDGLGSLIRDGAV